MAFNTQNFQCFNRAHELVTIAELTESEAKQELCRMIKLVELLDSKADDQRILIDKWRHGH
jgi:hypothetical protein